MTEQELVRGAARRLAIIRHAQEVTGNVALTCRYFGYNLEAIRSFLAKKAAKAVIAAKNQGKRKKRRKGTWTQILGSPDRLAADPPESGRAPPT